MKHKLMQALADTIIGVTVVALFPLIIAVIWLAPFEFWARVLVTDLLFFAFGLVLHNLFGDTCGIA